MLNILLLLLALVSAPAFAALPEGHRDARLSLSSALPLEQEFREQTLLTPAEFAPASELQMTSETFRRMETALVGTIDQVADIVVIVRDTSEGRNLSAGFKAKGGNTARLRTLALARDSFWYQDYGPIYSIDALNALVSNDFTYSRYNRRNDDAIPEKLAAAQNVRNRKVTMNYEGGNFISDGKGTCFASSRIYQQNSQLPENEVNQLMDASLGCRKLVVLTPLLDDITYHIDLFAKMVDDHTFVVGDFPDHPRNREIMNRNAATLQALGYTVHRLSVRNPSSQEYLTHVNSFLLNGFALVPQYGVPEDREAVELYTRLGFKVLPIDTADLSHSGGAVHCILRSKPAL